MRDMGLILSEVEQKTLLELARQTIISFVDCGVISEVFFNTPGLNSHLGCFVTIHQNGQLRGCIGNFISDKPLYKLVQEMSVAAATRDPRFYPMKRDDLATFNLEISVLSPLESIQTINDITVGTHGLYIVKGCSRGVLLPQVATEYGWDKEAFLQHTCIKAGLPEDAWQNDCTIYRFSAQIFKEPL